VIVFFNLRQGYVVCTPKPILDLYPPNSVPKASDIISVRHDTSQTKELISDNWLLKRLSPVLGADLSIAHRLLLGWANVAGQVLVVVTIREEK
jgi:hypothetical protein